MTNLASTLQRTATEHPEHTALKLDEFTLSYQELAQKAARVAGWLQTLGVRPGDRVAVLLPNLAEMPVVYYGILWAGATVVPMNPLFKSREIAYTLTDSEATALFAWAAAGEEAAKGADEAGCRLIPVGADFLAQVDTHATVDLIERESA